jgi:2-polyprenyl-3-methyl-5-hydroxy-6-metoxy-1,4-benzoquinol methylase
MAEVVAHYDGSARTYSRQYDPSLILDLDNDPANYFRLQTIVQRAADLGISSIFDLGMGDGSPLLAMAEMGIRVGGCDLSEEMLNVAREQFARHGLTGADAFFLGDIQDANSLTRGVAEGPFDAVMALGVLPHVRNERIAVRNMGMFVPVGGTIFLQFRNSLLSLFSFNRLTMEFVIDELLVNVPSGIRDEVRSYLEPRFAMDKPPKKQGTTEAPAYDEILAKFHNPFALQELVEQEGFGDVRFHWYNYHPAPPALKSELGLEFRHAGLLMEQEDSWRGMFLCSAGVIEATKLF